MFRTLAVTLSAAALTLSGAPANADPTPNVIVGSLDADWLFGTRHADIVFGLRGDDRLFGLRKDDWLFGNRGNDRLRAAGRHSGSDVLRGGRGFDRCTGDSSDTFISCEVVHIRG